MSMSINEITPDGIGIAALVGAARAVGDLLNERNVDLGVIQDAADDRGNNYTLVAFPRNPLSDPPILGVTVERNPRLVEIARAPVEHDPVHFWGSTRNCICIKPCCNDSRGRCTCPDCDDTLHEHPNA